MNNAQRKRYGSWAMVTGASQGIGAGFARELASQGFDVVLVSRSAKKLETLAKSLEETFKIQTRIVTSDLSKPGAAHEIMDQVHDLDVGLLISNAGAARMGGFLQNKVSDLGEDLILNTMSHMELSHVFGQRLRAQNRSGGILLVSSTAALQPMALGANYSASKAFVHYLGESLHHELAEVDIDVTVLLPGPTNTDGLNHRTDVTLGNLPMTAMSVEALVQQGLRALVRRKPSHVAGWMNRWIARLMPRGILARMFGFMLRRNTAPELLPSAPLATHTTNIRRAA